MSKRERQDRAIQRIEKTIKQHTSGTTLTEKILADKELKKTTEEIEKIRKKKLDRAQATLDNTKKKLRN
tara:strand:- start:9747 stop:9953 length:207 start_codon:yes stop_codon:yes gene_type:complete